jgi:hypothetical protein
MGWRQPPRMEVVGVAKWLSCRQPPGAPPCLGGQGRSATAKAGRPAIPSKPQQSLSDLRGSHPATVRAAPAISKISAPNFTPRNFDSREQNCDRRFLTGDRSRPDSHDNHIDHLNFPPNASNLQRSCRPQCPVRALQKSGPNKSWSSNFQQIAYVADPASARAKGTGILTGSIAPCRGPFRALRPPVAHNLPSQEDAPATLCARL